MERTKAKDPEEHARAVAAAADAAREHAARLAQAERARAAALRAAPGTMLTSLGLAGVTDTTERESLEAQLFRARPRQSAGRTLAQAYWVRALIATVPKLKVDRYWADVWEKLQDAEERMTAQGAAGDAADKQLRETFGVQNRD